MRKNYFLFPRMNLSAGGHFAQLALLENTGSLCAAEAVTYEAREPGLPFLDDLLADGDDGQDVVFFVHWGPHIPDLIAKLSGRNVVYAAYSTGYGFSVPADVPIIACSKHTQAYWGRYAPTSPVFYLPCEISPQFKNLGLARDIDVLVQKRKSSRYMLEELIPALQPDCAVTVLDTWVDDIAAVFNRSKVYLYDSTEHWAFHGVSEGFGLPPLEAMACGCTVFSSLNDALSDYLAPEFVGHQLRVYSKEYDVERVLKAVAHWQDEPVSTDLLAAYRKENIRKHLAVILARLNDFFDHKNQFEGNIPPVGLLPPEKELLVLRERLHKIESSRGWRWLAYPRRLYACLRQVLRQDVVTK